MRNIFKLIKRVFTTPKTYTLKEISDKQIESLRKKGAKIGENVDLIGAFVEDTFPYLITIGNNVTITNAGVLTHDASIKKTLGYTKVGRVEIGDDVFIGMNSLILPNTKIGNKVIVGAGCIVAKDIPDNSVVIGNPARVICSYDEYVEKMRDKMDKYPVADNESLQSKKEKIQECGFGFIK